MNLSQPLSPDGNSTNSEVVYNLHINSFTFRVPNIAVMKEILQKYILFRLFSYQQFGNIEQIYHSSIPLGYLSYNYFVYLSVHFDVCSEKLSSGVSMAEIRTVTEILNPEDIK